MPDYGPVWTTIHVPIKLNHNLFAEGTIGVQVEQESLKNRQCAYIRHIIIHLCRAVASVYGSRYRRALALSGGA